MKKDLCTAHVGIIVETLSEHKPGKFLCKAFNTETGMYPLVFADTRQKPGAFVKIPAEAAKAYYYDPATVTPASKREFSSLELAYLNETSSKLLKTLRAYKDMTGENGRIGNLRHIMRVAAVTCGAISDPLSTEGSTVQTLHQCPVRTI